MRKLVLGVAVLAVAAGGAVAWKSGWPGALRSPGPVPAAAASALPPQPSTAVATHRDIRFAITASGEIGPVDTVSVRPEIGGLIARLSLDIGDKVRKGEVLFTLNDYDLQTEKSSRRTEIEGARLAVQTQSIQLEKTRLVFERTKELFAQKLVPQEAYDNARIDHELAVNALDIARNRFETAQTALQTVEDKLVKTIIRAPFDCTILTRPVSIGQAVSGSGGFNSGTEVFTIANLEDMIVTAHLNQADVTRLKVGQEVAVQVEAVPGLKLAGKVDRLAPQATFKNGVKGFATRIILRNAEGVVRPGMTASLSIPVVSAGNVLAVPLAAVFSDRGERFAWVRKPGGGHERRPVNLGVADYDYVEVTHGLSDGDVVSLVTPTEPSPATVSAGAGKERAAATATR